MLAHCRVSQWHCAGLQRAIFLKSRLPLLRCLAQARVVAVVIKIHVVLDPSWSSDGLVCIHSASLTSPLACARPWAESVRSRNQEGVGPAFRTQPGEVGWCGK